MASVALAAENYVAFEFHNLSGIQINWTKYTVKR